MPTSAELLSQAVHHHQSGNLPRAEALYREILRDEPRNMNVLHMLGVLANQLGRLDLGIPLMRQAIAINPAVAAWHVNLGMALVEVGQLTEGVESFRQAVLLEPNDADTHYHLGGALFSLGLFAEAVESFQQTLRINSLHADAHNNLGNAFFGLAQPERAAECYRRALAIDPNHAYAHYNLGNTHKDRDNLDEAAACFRQALSLKPDFARAHFNLGNVLHAQGEFAAAAECYRRTLRTDPGNADAHNNLGIVLQDQEQPAEAAACFRQALRIDPNHAQARNSLGMWFLKVGRPDEAVTCLEEAIRLLPAYAEAHANLGNVLKDQGRLDDAIACFQRAQQLERTRHAFHSNLLFTQLYHPRYDGHALSQELQRWEREQAARLFPVQEPNGGREEPLARKHSADRRLRIGYVSPDFCDHVVGRNIWPLLRLHDHRQFEIFLYAHPPKTDNITERMRRCADHWCDIIRLPDEQVATRIRQDGIDILVDLALHTAGNRLLIFARKPAPVQVTFAGYPGSTGLSVIDYRLTDPYLDPAGSAADRYAEESYCLPHSFWCYDPTGDEPVVTPLPALKKGFVTFGCLNNFCKINEDVLRLWARVLSAVDGSHLLLQTQVGSHRQRTCEFLAGLGIAAYRIEFCSRQPRLDYLNQYHTIDVGLDTFPYNGHTTSLDSFWMGVPVITLIGGTVVGRGGFSQLTNLGLPDFAASTPAEFVTLAVNLARDRDKLVGVRGGLRERMQRSSLMDAVGFTEGIEQAYRSMWRRFLQKNGKCGPDSIKT